MSLLHDSRFRTVARASGAAAPVVTLGAILVSTLLSPTFSWADSALSDLGRAGAPTAPIFNGGLILGAILALPYVARVALAAERLLTRLGAATFGLAALSMGLVGVFPTGTAYHFPAAVSLYLFVTYGLFLYGSGRVRAGAARGQIETTTAGLAAIWLGVGHLTSWLAWGAGLRVGPGLAIPETVGAAIFVAWIRLSWPLATEDAA
ncbi:DUF998 domain-containing protein (plasmid) [Halorussus limi]|uniref:DUF998 domain-containing protein n=1 Tax=Halorussus limi TaxID=2938695 RepID=A0A8U0I078_9EURY|nr:DUF998 domain-containing protein [Halorussus limi]UPV76587.1 DUF998 domain-containing protein [Halorussus limi]